MEKLCIYSNYNGCFCSSDCALFSAGCMMALADQIALEAKQQTQQNNMALSSSF